MVLWSVPIFGFRTGYGWIKSNVCKPVTFIYISYKQMVMLFWHIDVNFGHGRVFRHKWVNTRYITDTMSQTKVFGKAGAYSRPPHPQAPTHFHKLLRLLVFSQVPRDPAPMEQLNCSCSLGGSNFNFPPLVLASVSCPWTPYFGQCPFPQTFPLGS